MKEVKRGKSVGGLFDTYQEYLYSEIWQDKRKFMLRMYPKCYECNKDATQVHHKTYEHIGNESEKDLVTLCKLCHENKRKKGESDGRNKLQGLDKENRVGIQEANKNRR